MTLNHVFRLLAAAFAAAFVCARSFAQAEPPAGSTTDPAAPSTAAPETAAPASVTEPAGTATPPSSAESTGETAASAMPAAPPPVVATTAAPAPAPQLQPTAVAASPTPANPDEMSPSDPLAGWSGDTVYLRSADNNFILMPGGRLQVDSYFFKRDTDKMPTPSVLLRRARLEIAGWVGPYVYYNLAGDFAAGPPAGADPVAQSWLGTTDNFVGIAPWKNLAMLQVGQFDAPFTLENRTSDKYFDFMERSLTVRAFAIPSNKETGAMVHGLLPDKIAYYSLGLFNGDGQNFRNVDSNFDVMGRAWIAPGALAGEKSLEDITVGGSFWLGDRGPASGTDSASALRLASQSTQGGFTFLDPTWTISTASATPGGAATTTPVEVHQNGKLRAFALELNVPIQHRFGIRTEYVRKRQDLSADNASKPAALVSLAHGQLDGWSIYGEAYYWVLGDDTILPAPGLELQSRLKKFETTAPRYGLMLAARVEHLDETVTLDKTLASNTVSGSRKINAFELGANYWYSKRFRASFNYVLNVLDGDSKGIAAAKAKLAGNKTEHELLFRLGIAL